VVPDGWGLGVAFVVYGLREIGEPARKALITALMPAPTRAKAVGLYWGLRSAATCWASLVGAVIWYWWGPEPLLYLAAAIGGFGAVVFYAMVGQARLTEPVPEREVLAP
jgi:MFS family permease